MSITGFANFTKGAFDDLVNLKSLRNTPTKVIYERPTTFETFRAFKFQETFTVETLVNWVDLYSDSNYFPWNGRNTSLQKFMEFFEQLPTSLEKIDTNVINDDRFCLRLC